MGIASRGEGRRYYPPAIGTMSQEVKIQSSATTTREILEDLQNQVAILLYGKPAQACFGQRQRIEKNLSRRTVYSIILPVAHRQSAILAANQKSCLTNLDNMIKHALTCGIVLHLTDQ